MSRALPGWRSSCLGLVLLLVYAGWMPKRRLAWNALWHHTTARSVFSHGMRREPWKSSPQPEVGCHKDEKDRGDDAIHGEKGGIQAAQVAGGNEGVLISQQEGNGGDAKPAEYLKLKQKGEPDEETQDGEVHGASGPEGCRDADGLGQAVKASGAVVFDVLTGIKNVKAADPQSDGGGEHEDAGVERAADGNPGCRGGEPQRE